MKYENTLSGKGAAINGARWNSPGVKLIYSSENKSLAMAEASVHFTLATLPLEYMMTIIYIPDPMGVQKISESELATDWKVFPHSNSIQKFGDKFIQDNKSYLLRVLSVVAQGDFNILINPNHKDFINFKTEKFPFDKRIFK